METSSLYQYVEIILFPVLLQNKNDYKNEDDIWNTRSDILYYTIYIIEEDNSIGGRGQIIGPLEW